jgi:bifunctional non-homologous end joining protein LigD
MPRLDLTKIPGARKAPMPTFIPLQLATLVDEPPSGDEWLHELKFDGYRMLGRLELKGVLFWSRNHKDWTAKFPHVAKAVKALPAKTAMLDGEIVALDSRGRASFQKLQQAIGVTDAGFVYNIFDLIYLDGFNLTKTPLLHRKALLQQLLSSVDDKGQLRYSDHVEGNGRAFFKQACEYGIEGIVSKRADSTYESTRSRSWQKMKCNKRQEFVIAGYTHSKKGFPGFGALALGVFDKGRLVYAGRVGTGFSIKQRLEIQKMLDRIARSTTPFAVKPIDPGLRDIVWTEPKLVGEVEFSEWTSDGLIRHPSFQGLREDKSASEVRREEPAEGGKVKPAKRKRPSAADK